MTEHTEWRVPPPLDITPAVVELTNAIKDAGLPVYLSIHGWYGFFTNRDGSRVVSFSCPDGKTVFYGNYTTDDSNEYNCGWKLDRSMGFDAMLEEIPPKEVVGSAAWRHTTMEEHLALYQSTSNYDQVLS